MTEHYITKFATDEINQFTDEDTFIDQSDNCLSLTETTFQHARI